MIRRCLAKLLDIDLHGVIHVQTNLSSSGRSGDMDVDDEFSDENETDPQKRSRYLNGPMSEMLRHEMLRHGIHLGADPTSTLGNEDDSAALAELSEARNRALAHARNMHEAAEVRSNQEEMWYRSAQIDRFTFRFFRLLVCEVKWY